MVTLTRNGLAFLWLGALTVSVTGAVCRLERTRCAGNALSVRPGTDSLPVPQPISGIIRLPCRPDASTKDRFRVLSGEYRAKLPFKFHI